MTRPHTLPCAITPGGQMFLLGAMGEGTAASVWPPMACHVCKKASALVNITMTKDGNRITCWNCAEEEAA